MASNTIVGDRRYPGLQSFSDPQAAVSNAFAGMIVPKKWTEMGLQVEQRLQKLMKELGQAINESISDSEQIAEVIAKIKSGGYDVFLVLEATIGFNKREEEESSLVSFQNGTLILRSALKI